MPLSLLEPSWASLFLMSLWTFLALLALLALCVQDGHVP
ncbi:MAG: hypothetical protein RLZZ134_36 [Pseudomonadota bacterium]